MAKRIAPIALDPKLVLETSRSLVVRIEERFNDPDMSLLKVARSAVAHAEVIPREIYRLGKANWPLRFFIFIVVLATIASAALAIYKLKVNYEVPSLAELLQASEAGLNLALLLALGLIYLVGQESKIRVRKCVAKLNAIRSTMQVLDKLQLQKDPHRVDAAPERTEHSPKLGGVNSAFLLERYLDYCSELMAILTSIGELYVSRVTDPGVTEFAQRLALEAASYRQIYWLKIQALKMQPIAPPEEAAKPALPALPKTLSAVRPA